MTHFIKYKDEIINLDRITSIKKIKIEKDSDLIDFYHKDKKITGNFFGINHKEIWMCKSDIKQYDYLIRFDIDSDQYINSFIFDTEEERDEYFLKIQERIEKSQGFKIDLGDENE